ASSSQGAPVRVRESHLKQSPPERQCEGGIAYYEIIESAGEPFRTGPDTTWRSVTDGGLRNGTSPPGIAASRGAVRTAGRAPLGWWLGSPRPTSGTLGGRTYPPTCTGTW